MNSSGVKLATCVVESETLPPLAKHVCSKWGLIAKFAMTNRELLRGCDLIETLRRQSVFAREHESVFGPCADVWLIGNDNEVSCELAIVCIRRNEFDLVEYGMSILRRLTS